MADEPQTWFQQLGAIGGLGAITGLLGWIAGHKVQRANARKTNAEADQIEESRGADMQRAINDSFRAGAESWDKQVTHLIDMVETLTNLNKAQTAKIDAQNGRIAALEDEVRRLTLALDKARTECPVPKASRCSIGLSDPMPPMIGL